MKNVEKADRIHLGSLVEDLKKGHFAIPDFQREFEWQPWDVLELIKSVFMDYYIGTLLLWKGSKENFKMLSCEPIYGFNGRSDSQHIVLDGQQRLTAIYYAFFRPEKAFPGRTKPMVYFLNIQSFLEEDFENAFWYDSLTKKNIALLNDTNQQYEQHIFPLGIMKEGTWGTSDWIKGYRDFWYNKANNSEAQNNNENFLLYSESAKSFKEVIEELFNQYYISYIELDRDIDIAKVCDIFTQINSKGVRLDIFDLLNAILRPKDIYLKKMWHEAEKDLSFTDPKKMKIYVLQVMSILEQAYCSAKYLYYLVPEAIKTIKKHDGSREQVVLVNSNEDFISRWNNSIKSLKRAIQSLKSPRDFGAIQPNFVPYPSIIPAYAAIKSYVENSDAINKLDIQTKIRKWYWSSIFTNRYSSSVESTSAKDFQDLKKWFLNDDDEPEIISEFIRSYRDIDLLHDNPKGSAIYNAIFNLFVINEARDWSTFDLPEYESLDDHHIVPHSIFHEQAGKTINSILNRTPLSSSTNRHIIRNRMPNEYIKEMLENNEKEKVYKVLASHLISKKAVEILLREPFTKNDFDEFLQERLETIRNAIENQLIKEKINVPIALQTLNKDIETIEIKLRKLIIIKTDDDFETYKTTTPSHIQEKVEKRIDLDLKKKPGLSKKDFSRFSNRLKYFDLFEYYDTVVSKNNWHKFEQVFQNKSQLQNRFNQLSTLRNCIRHSREISSIERLDGEASIKWFYQTLNNHENR
jgi:hypothetical protein